MTLLDAYALIAFVAGGPAAPDVRALLREGTAAVATANLAEVLDVSQRVHGVSISRTLEILEPLLAGPLEAIALDTTSACRAAAIRAEHYHRESRPISLADAVLVGSAGAAIASPRPTGTCWLSQGPRVCRWSRFRSSRDRSPGVRSYPSTRSLSSSTVRRSPWAKSESQTIRSSSTFSAFRRCRRR